MSVVYETECRCQCAMSTSAQAVSCVPVPKLWSDTIDAHRRTVREAILDVTATLVAERGLRSVTMSQIAERAGIGRATLYKYFPDVETILLAWHERQIAGHLAQLTALRDGPGTPAERLRTVLESYGRIQFEHRGDDVAMQLHGGRHVAQAERHLRDLLEALVQEGADAGELRDDVPPRELAAYCLHALDAAAGAASKAAVKRLVGVTLSGLRPGG
jgi:AcrR family transcriptional regulator